MVRVLFVCLGNICRSPMAEALLTQKVAQAGLSHQILVDSAGTGPWHEGQLADPRTRAELRAQGVPAPSRARQITSLDLEESDHIIVMDRQNFRDVLALAPPFPDRISLLRSWIPGSVEVDVADPYLGGAIGFSGMYVILDQACTCILFRLVN